MSESQFDIRNILENLNKVTSELTPNTKKGGKGGKQDIEVAPDLSVALQTLRTCVEDLAKFVKNEKETKADLNNTLREHEDEIDHLKQKSLFGKIIISSSIKEGSQSKIKSKEQLEAEGKTLKAHVVELALLKYTSDISEGDIANCFYLPKGGIITFWKKWSGSAFQNLVGKIKTATNSHMNLFFNFMLTQRRSKLLFEIRKLKKSGKIMKFYSDEEGRISIKKERSDKKRVTDFYEKGSSKLKTWQLEDLHAEIQ